MSAHYSQTLITSLT
nr:unnamed protein product [Callosobruchus chinensis]CAH7729523.1 unnamed protein product [Callosobruchus chinensis]CAH7767841.1 unnamed protein product [Callosobruchus chinensis]CAH7769678.1 unnamed protein product [Callosobruchus chinensis]